MPPICFLLLFVFTLSSCAAVFQQGSKAQGLLDSRPARSHNTSNGDTDSTEDAATIPTPQVPDIDIDNYLVRSSLSDSMQQTLDLIKNVESLPSCARIASSALLHSCSALEGSIKHDETELSRGSDLFIEEEADIYSARLAVCELSGADFAIPKQCQSFIPTEKNKRKRGVRGFWSKEGPSQPSNLFQYYDEITLSHLQQCRRALGSTSQSWTSYSNNRQNAVVMCRAMRSEVEKDEQLHVGKVLAGAAAAATGSLQDAFEAVNLLKMRFSELATAMPRFQQDLAAGNEQQLQYVQQFWAEIERVRDGLRGIFQDFDQMQEDVRTSRVDVSDLSLAIRKAATDSTVSMQDLAAQTHREMTALSENAAALSEVGEYMLELFQQGLIKSLYSATQDIDAINAFMPTITRELNTWREANQRMHEESVNMHKENQAYLNKTTATLEQFSQAAQDMNATLTSITGIMRTGWPGAVQFIKTTATFVGSAIIYTLVGYGIWEKYAALSVSGNVLASTATGLTLSFISTFHFGPVDLFHTLSRFEITLDGQLVLGIIVGAISFAILAAVTSAIRRTVEGRRQVAHYDPASPPYSPGLPTKEEP